MVSTEGLTPRIDLWYSQKWNDITDDVMSRDGILVERGRGSEDVSGFPSTCSLTLANRDARYSPRNASSPLFGLIGRNTRIRVGAGRPPVAATSTGSGSSLAAPAVTAEATGLQVCAFAAQPVGNSTVPAGFTGLTERDVFFSTFRAAYRDAVGAGDTGVETFTYSTSASGYATVNVHVPGATYVSNVSRTEDLGGDPTVDPAWSAGAGLLAVTAWSGDRDGRMQPPQVEAGLGVGWTLLGDSGPSDGPRIMAWWCVPVSDPGSVTLVGARDGASEAYLQVVVTSGQADWFPRFTGEVAEFPQRWSPNGADAWVPLRASGVSRRLLMSTADRSALTSFYATRPRLVGYWPLDDVGVGAFSSGLSGGSPMAFASGSAGTSPAPSLGAYSGFAGSGAVAEFNGAGAAAPLAPPVDTHAWGAGVLVHVPDAGWTDGANLLTLEFTGGHISAFLVEADTGSNLVRKIVFSDGTTTETSAEDLSADFPGGFTGGRLSVAFTLEQNGADVDWSLVVVNLDDPDLGFAHINGSVSSKTLGAPQRVGVGVELVSGETLHATDVAFGHAWVTSDAVEFLQTFGQASGSWSLEGLRGFAGDTVAQRVFRACRDDAGVFVSVRDGAVDAVMGVQPVASPVGVLTDSEETSSGGRLFDAAGFPGLTFRDRVSKESQAARLVLDLAGGEVSAVAGVEDDQLTVNDVTVTRLDGGAGRATDEASIASVGRYSTAVTLNLREQPDAVQHAAWRVHLGSDGSARWPEVEVTWPRSGQLAAGGLLEVGDWVTLTNVPAWAGGVDADLIVEGVRDSFDSAVWRTTYVCVPAAPWAVGIAEASDARWDTIGDADDPDAYPPIYIALA